MRDYLLNITNNNHSTTMSASQISANSWREIAESIGLDLCTLHRRLKKDRLQKSKSGLRPVTDRLGLESTTPILDRLQTDGWIYAEPDCFKTL